MYMSTHRHDTVREGVCGIASEHRGRPRSLLYSPPAHPPQGQFFPGTGAAEEVGLGIGQGFTVNVPWSGPGVGDADIMAAFQLVVVPIAKEFSPDVVSDRGGSVSVEAKYFLLCDRFPAGLDLCLFSPAAWISRFAGVTFVVGAVV